MNTCKNLTIFLLQLIRPVSVAQNKLIEQYCECISEFGKTTITQVSFQGLIGYPDIK